MLREGQRGLRQRMYSLTALGVATLVAIVLLVTAQHMTMAKYKRTTYKYPYKTLLRLAEVQARFSRLDVDQNGRHDYAGSLELLAEHGLITDELNAGVVQGYRYRIEHADERTWAGSASPAEVTTSSIFYWIDQSQLIRAEFGRPATKESRIYYDPLQGFTGSMGVRLPDSEGPR